MVYREFFLLNPYVITKNTVKNLIVPTSLIMRFVFLNVSLRFNLHDFSVEKAKVE